MFGVCPVKISVLLNLLCFWMVHVITQYAFSMPCKKGCSNLKSRRITALLQCNPPHFHSYDPPITMSNTIIRPLFDCLHHPHPTPTSPLLTAMIHLYHTSPEQYQTHLYNPCLTVYLMNHNVVNNSNNHTEPKLRKT